MKFLFAVTLLVVAVAVRAESDAEATVISHDENVAPDGYKFKWVLTQQFHFWIRLWALMLCLVDMCEPGNTPELQYDFNDWWLIELQTFHLLIFQFWNQQPNRSWRIRNIDQCWFGCWRIRCQGKLFLCWPQRQESLSHIHLWRNWLPSTHNHRIDTDLSLKKIYDNKILWITKTKTKHLSLIFVKKTIDYLTGKITLIISERNTPFLLVER